MCICKSTRGKKSLHVTKMMYNLNYNLSQRFAQISAFIYSNIQSINRIQFCSFFPQNWSNLGYFFPPIFQPKMTTASATTLDFTVSGRSLFEWPSKLVLIELKTSTAKFFFKKKRTGWKKDENLSFFGVGKFLGVKLLNVEGVSWYAHVLFQTLGVGSESSDHKKISNPKRY